MTERNPAMSEALKPCPFCGRTPEEGRYGFDLYIVRCPECKCVQQTASTEAEARKEWNSRATHNSSSFFRNADCEYFPCHKVTDTENFNCLFCYCPLYRMPECPGTPEYLVDGVKDCTNCTLPHYDYDRIIEALKEAAK